MSNANISPALRALVNAIPDYDARDQITRVLNGSPSLLNMYNNLAAGNNGVVKLIKIEWNSSASDGSGFFNRSTGVLHMGAGWVLNPKVGGIDPDRLAYLMGHEGQHDAYSSVTNKADDDFAFSVSVRASSGGNAPHDYTNILLENQKVHLIDEGRSDIAGWNAAVQTLATQKGRALSKDEIGELSGKFDLSFYDYYGNLKPGFAADSASPGLISLSDSVSIQNSANQYAQRTPSVNNGILVTYSEYYGAAKLLDKIASAENGKTFILDFAALKFDANPSGPDAPALTTTQTIDLLISSGLIGKVSGSRFAIVNKADGSTSSFTVNGDQLDVSIQSTSAGNSVNDKRSYSAGVLTKDVLSTDLNNDGKPDIVITKAYGSYGVTTTTQSYANGNLNRSESVNTSQDGKTVTTTTDLNGDGRADIVNYTIYMDSTRNVLSRDITVNNDWNTGTSTRTTIDMHPNDGISSCTRDTQTTDLLTGRVLSDTKTLTSSNGKNSLTQADTNGDGKYDNLTLGIDLNGDGVMDKFISTGNSINSLLDADKQVQSSYKAGQLGSGTWNIYNDWSTAQLVSQPRVVSGGLITIYGSGVNLNPIGAFYESKSAGNDPALSIASKTFRILNSANQALSAAQLSALDTNKDGKLSGAELAGLNAWSDLNEDGILNAGEMTPLRMALMNAGLSSLRSTDYGFYTAGNANARSVAENTATAPVNSLVAPIMLGAAASNYRSLRDTDNRFYINSVTWIDWAPNQIKLSSNQQNLVGTDGNDNFDINYYAQYNGKFFDLSRVQNFYAGGGDDVMGGSARNDNLWGGTGNDVLFGYDGDDRLYGEEGNDQLQGGNGNDLLDSGSGNDVLLGQDGNNTLIGGDGIDELQGGNGNDVLDGGTGDDRLFGHVGNDTMNGGDRNDLMMGFTGTNEAKQTLNAGENRQ